MENQIHIDIGTKAFEANKAKFVAAYNADRFNEDKNTTYRITCEGSLQDCKFDDGYLRIGLSGPDGLDLYLTIKIEPDADMIVAMAETVIKQYNRAKTFFEARPR